MEEKQSNVKTCIRCHKETSKINLRNEALCVSCFQKYIKSKVVKRLEALRTTFFADRRAEKLNILLPLSLASPTFSTYSDEDAAPSCSSSLVLLDVLSEYLEQQVARSRRAAFAVHVCSVHFPDASLDPTELDSKAEAQKRLEEVRQRYPNHTYSVVSPLDAPSREDGRLLQSTVSSPTSRADMAQMLLISTVADAALARGCEAVLWADSTTRLAEKILAHAAKGRGASIPWLVNDCRSPYTHGTDNAESGLVFAYPMRDLLKKELVSFAGFAESPLPLTRDRSVFLPEQTATRQKKFVVNSKTASIDDLMHDYFRSVEHDYPSIVANVVRTSSKLQPQRDVLATTNASGHDTKSRRSKLCEICSMPLLLDRLDLADCLPDEENLTGQLDDGNNGARGEEETKMMICYGCEQSIYGTT